MLLMEGVNGASTAVLFTTGGAAAKLGGIDCISGYKCDEGLWPPVPGGAMYEVVIMTTGAAAPLGVR